MASINVVQIPLGKANTETAPEQFRLFKISRSKTRYYFKGRILPITVEGGQTALVAETSLFSADAQLFDSNFEASEAAQQLNNTPISNALWDVEIVDANQPVDGL